MNVKVKNELLNEEEEFPLLWLLRTQSWTTGTGIMKRNKVRVSVITGNTIDSKVSEPSLVGL
jgi:hypothetical protein